MSIMRCPHCGAFVDTDANSICHSCERPVFQECAWCGAELIDGVFSNRRGEDFCSKSHRDSSNRALKRLIDAHESPA